MASSRNGLLNHSHINIRRGCAGRKFGGKVADVRQTRFADYVGDEKRLCGCENRLKPYWIPDLDIHTVCA